MNNEYIYIYICLYIYILYIYIQKYICKLAINAPYYAGTG